MAFNAYLVFYPDKNDIKGESTSDLFPKDTGAIEITDYSFATAMPVTASRSDGGGATVGRANFEAFTCNKNIDTSTPKLVEYCCLGKNIAKIGLHLFRAGAENDTGAVKYAMAVFKHCVITKVGISGGGEELPKEALEFNYGICEYHYQETDHSTGKIDKDMRYNKFGWSTIQNKVHSQLEDMHKA
jgi:type VI secretion system secreted protein Hcp